MGRWTDQDDDSERLPEGFERVGYDADTQTYTFRDANGRYYESEEGNRYGTLRPKGQRRPSPTADETLAQNEEIKRSNREAVRHMLPFALLVLVFLLLLFNFVGGFGGHASPDGDSTDNSREQIHCSEGADKVQIQKGDTCWEIGKTYGLGVKEFLGIKGNEDVDCERLEVGSWVVSYKMYDSGAGTMNRMLRSSGSITSLPAWQDTLRAETSKGPQHHR